MPKQAAKLPVGMTGTIWPVTLSGVEGYTALGHAKAITLLMKCLHWPLSITYVNSSLSPKEAGHLPVEFVGMID